MRRKNVLLMLVFTLWLTVSALTDDRNKFSIDLYLDWEYVATPQISPDGSQVVYARRWTDKVNDKFENEIRALKLRKVDMVMGRLNDEYHPFNFDFGTRHLSNRIQPILYVRGWFDKYKK